MSDPLTDAANAIDKASPKIKAFAQLAASRIEADEAEQARKAAELVRWERDLTALEARVAKLEGTPAPPPPPVPGHLGNGFILFRYGNSWNASPVTGYERYGVVVVGYGNDLDAAKLSPAVGSAYRTCVEVPDVSDVANSFGGVVWTQALQLGAVMKDTNGSAMHPSAGVYAGDMGLPGYQAAWCKNVNARLSSVGLKTLFMDNVVPNCWFGTPKLASGLSFADAYVSLLKAQQEQMPGVYRIANCGPGGAVWASRIAPYCDGLLNENPASGSDLATWMDAVQGAGRDAFVLITGDPASLAVKTWAQTFAGKWNRKGGGFGVDHGDPDPWNANWTSVIV